MTLCIPRVHVIGTVICQIAVGIVSGAIRVVIVVRVVPGNERRPGAASGYGLRNISERVVGKILLPGGSSAMSARQARHIIIAVVAGLSIAGVEGIGNR